MIAVDYSPGPWLTRSIGVVSLGSSYIGGAAGLVIRAPLISAELPHWMWLLHPFMQAVGTVGYHTATGAGQDGRASAGAIAAGGIGFGQLGIWPGSVRIGLATTTISGFAGSDFGYFAAVSLGW